MSRYVKRLIEVDLPIKRISEHSRREKSIRHGHISTLHIWWARRPLAACRAVICASLWPDPADELCPDSFVAIARATMMEWARRNLLLSGEESYTRFVIINKDPEVLSDPMILRQALLDFIADFSNWDNSTKPQFLNVSRTLTQAAHESLGGTPGTRPLIVDPFAGGGSIPVEALRVGADTFASDLNPVAVLLNKVVLEFIPRFGNRLSLELRKWGAWIQKDAAKQLNKYYPPDDDGDSPIAYLWARTIQCEGPGCGAEIPLIGRTQIAQRKDGTIALSLKGDTKSNVIKVNILQGATSKSTLPTCRGFVATCPRSTCGYTTPKKSVQKQLTEQKGGVAKSRLMVVLTEGKRGRQYRLATEKDILALKSVAQALAKQINTGCTGIPTEPIPSLNAHRAVGSQLPLYGFETWGDLFSPRQQLSLLILQESARKVYHKLLEKEDETFAKALFILLSFAIDKQVDYSSSLCRWVSKGEFIAGTLAGEKKIPMIADYAESNPVGNGSGSWMNHIDWISRFVDREARIFEYEGIAVNSSADDCPLPIDSVDAMITDPPYYDSVPYADLSDFYFVWLKRTLMEIGYFENIILTPKAKQMTVDQPRDGIQKDRYEELLTGAFLRSREMTIPSGVGVIVFAHKSTSGWEALLDAIVNSGWIISASWPIDTERSARPNAFETASLTSSVHLVCRPRENQDGSYQVDYTGDWRDILAELPERIHAWMPRLAEEGVVGADAIFACLGPALEIFSRYSAVERANGEAVTLKEYLEQVWAAVAKEALTMIFEGADASGFEEDARLTAMWLWTLKTGDSGLEKTSDSDSDDEEEDSERSKTAKKRKGGFGLEFDAARKIAQGLGARIEDLKSLVEVSGDTARLLPVAERARALFGKDEGKAIPAKRKREPQLDMFKSIAATGSEESTVAVMKVERIGDSVLDRVHQSMILFGANRSEALRRFLVEDGAGNDPRFWRLAQALSALYPTTTEEKRWVDGVLARKKGMGF